MKLILCFLMFIFSATSCWKQNAKPKVEHRQLNQKKVFSKDEKTDSKKDIYINQIDDKSLPVICQSDQKKGEIKPEDVNKVNSTGYTLLLKAVMKNDLVRAKELLLLGVDPNIARRDTTPIGWAVHNNNKEMVALLLSHGAKVIFKKDGKSDSIIHLDLDNNQEILDIILCHFADIGKKDSV